MVQDPLEERLNTILQVVRMTLQMKVKESVTNSLQDPAMAAAHHTCNGIVILCRSWTLATWPDIVRGMSRTTTKKEPYST